MNQLVREDNKLLDRSYVYEYDTAGNITAKSEYSYVNGNLSAPFISRKLYSYETSGWKDKLISYDGQSITYDVLGNPLTYLGHTLTWDRVRQLKSFDNNTFEYDAQGRRVKKNYTWYEYQDGKLYREGRENGSIITYLYDTTGICGFSYKCYWEIDETTSLYNYKETNYFYRKNLQGDITAIYSSDGTKVAEYLYDAWGNCTITYDLDGIATINPIRYRGYYYDTETGLYYLNSRYYDPNTGRFINADVYVSTGQGILGTNMYAYCGNEPINRIDLYGEAWGHWILGAALVVICAAATVATCGGFAAAVTAVGMVASGGAAFTLSSTVAASAFVGSSVAFGAAVSSAALNSDSIEDFGEQGNFDVVLSTAVGAGVGGTVGYNTAKNILPDTKKYNVTSGTTRPEKTSTPNTRYIQYDQNTGQTRTDAVYGSDGRMYSRVDYMHTHNINGIDYQPHIHFSPAINSQGLPVGRSIVMPW